MKHKQNNTKFPYSVEVLLNQVRTPKKRYPFKTKRAAEKFARGVRSQPLFVAAYIHTPDGKVGTVLP